MDGDENDAFGDDAMEENTTGSENTAMGDDALDSNTDRRWKYHCRVKRPEIRSSTATTTWLWVTMRGLVSHASNVVAINVPGVSSVFGDASDTCYIGSIYNEPIGGAGTPRAVFVDADVRT